MIWKFKLKNSKLNRPFTKSDVYTLKFKKIKWERNRSVLDNPTRWANTVGYYWLRFYWIKPDSHKTQRHEGELKANENHILGHLSIFHSWLKLRRLVAVGSAFSGQDWSELIVVTHLPLYWVLQKTISRKSLCQIWNKTRSLVD